MRRFTWLLLLVILCCAGLLMAGASAIAHPAGASSGVVQASGLSPGNALGLPLAPANVPQARLPGGAGNSAPPAAAQGRNAPTVAISSIASGNWSDPTRWSSGTVPTAADDVTIANGTTITVDTAAVALSVTVGQGASGILQFDPAVARSLTVGGNVTVAIGGIFQANPAGTIATHALSLGGNLTNSGTIDFSQNTNTSQVAITFTGAANATFVNNGGATLNLKGSTAAAGVTLNKGTSTASLLDFLPGGTVTVQGAGTNGFLTITNGTFRISGGATFSNPIFNITAYVIPATGGIWLNNANATIAGQNGSPTNNGLLRLTAGTYNIGTASGNSMGAGNGASFIIEGGTMNVAGRLTSANIYITYTQSAGTVNVSTVGNGAATPSFGFTGGTGVVMNMSGGTINLVQASTNAAPLDYNQTGTMVYSGGTLNLGTAATATNFVFRVQGQMPAVVIDNTTNNKTANLSAQGNVWGNLTIPTGTTLNLNSFTLLQIGPTITNNGAIVVTTNNTGGVNFAGALQTLGASYAQTYTGTGTFGSAALRVTSLSLQNPQGLTINAAVSLLNVYRINVFYGAITNSSRIALGAGDATALVIQRGVTGSAFPAGSLDVAPTFNIGTGGLILVYAQSQTLITTGPEIPATRSVASIQIINPTGVTLTGGPLTATNTTSGLLLSSGTLNTSAANLLTLSGAATTAVSGGSAATWVNGPLARTLPASLVTGSTYTFPVGKGSFKQFELVNPTTNAGGTVVVQVEAFDADSGGTGGAGFSDINHNRYWSAQITSGAANFTNTTVRLTEQGTPGANAIGQSATQAGAYASIGGVVTPPTIGPSTTTSTTLGFFAVGRITGAPTLSGSFTVGAGGTYTTLTAAVADLNSKLMTGPVTFVLTDNSYAGETYPITINPNGGNSPANTLTIKPAAGATPAFSGSSATALLVLNGIDFVTLDGSNTAGGTSRDTTFTNTNTSVTSAVIWGQTVGTADPTVNNTIKNLNIIGNATTTTLVGIGFGSNTISSASLGTRNDNNTIQNNNINTLQFGIYSQGAQSPAKNFGTVITGNLLGGTGLAALGRAGIFVGFEDGVQITNNTVAGVTAANSADVFGIALGSIAISATAFTTNDDVANAVISRNFIGPVIKTDTFSAAGISLGTPSYGTSRIVNNSVYGVVGNGTSGDFCVGIYIGSTGTNYATTQVYFNSVSMTGARDSASVANQPSYALAILGANPLADVRNNSLYNTQTASGGGAGGPAGSYTIGLSAIGLYSFLTSNYNDLYTSGASSHFSAVGALANVLGDRPSLAAWQATTGKDGNSISADPLYTSPTNLQPLAGSPLFGAGQSIAGITTDILGALRGSPPSIGAYEGPAVGPTATATATPTITLTPTVTQTACPLGQTYTVSNGGAAIVPGTTRVDGTGCDDCGSTITLPFPVQIYDQTFTTAVAGSNGYLSFGTSVDNFYTGCLPNAGFSYTIFPFEVDQTTGVAGKGIFTLTTGSTPNRTFYVEWRNCLYNTATSCLPNSDNNYEVVFQEGQTSYSIVYGTFGPANATVGAIGVQKNGTTYSQTQCNAGAPAVSQQTYTLGCAVPTATATGTDTATSTATATPTNTNTATATPTITLTSTNTATATPTITLTSTNTATATPTVTLTSTNTATATPTVTLTSTNTATATPTITLTSTNTATATPTITLTSTNTATATPTVTLTSTNTATATPTVTLTRTNTATATPTITLTSTSTATATPTITLTSTNTATTVPNTATPTPTVCASTSYGVGNSTGTIVPGTTDISSHCDDCNVGVTLPFPVTLYGTTYSTAQVGSNGYLSFGGLRNDFYTGCLPSATFTATIFPFEVDQTTAAPGKGIYTVTTGTAPNRTFYVEWRNCLYNTATSCLANSDNNYEIVFQEGQPSFSIVYGVFGSANATVGAIGVQQSGTVYNQTQCNAGAPASSQQTYTLVPCGGTPTTTPTATASATCSPSGVGGPWTAASPIPAGINAPQLRNGFAQTTTDFYLVGGLDSGFAFTGRLLSYNLASGLWTTLASMPVTPGEATSAAYWNGKLYSVGGQSGGVNQTQFQIYDIATNTWTAGAAIPLGTYGAAMGAFNNKVFVAGGTSPSGPTTTLQIYDIASGTWSTGTTLPGTGYFLGGSTQVGQYLYLAGSYGTVALNGVKGGSAGSLLGGKKAQSLAPAANSTDTLRLDMTSAPGVWTTGPVFTPARADFALSFFGNKLYAIGGDTTGGSFFNFSNLVDELDLSAWPAGSWAASPPLLPSARQANQAGFFNSSPPRIWSTGGYNGAAFSEHLYRQFSAPCATPTVTATATATPTITLTSTNTATVTATACPLGQTYTVSNSSAAIVPGTTDIGNHCDDCSSGITLPFPVTLYDQTFTTAQVGSNGYLSFGTTNDFFYTGCLPAPTFTYTILPFAVDQITGATGKGVYTLTTGSAPNRTFYVEWRACRYNGATTCLANSDNNYEVVFQEGQTSYSIVYGTFGAANATVGAIGVQKNGTTYSQTQCNAGPPAVSQQTYTLGCAVPTATATSTNTATNTATATPTITLTSTNTATATPTITLTSTNTATATPTITLTSTNTATATPTITLTSTNTATATPTITLTSTNTATATPTITLTSTNTATATPTITLTRTNTATATPTITLTSTNTATATPTITLTSTNTATATSTSTATATATLTITQTSTRTSTATPTITQTSTSTATVVPNTATATQTNVANTATATQTNVANTATATQTNVANTATATQTGIANTATATQTNVANTATATQTGIANTATTTRTATAVANTATATQTGVANTATVTQTGVPSTVTATQTGVPSATNTVGPTETPCPIRFTDVTDPSTYYYTAVYYLACHGIVSGYSDGTYKPFNNTTRAQMTKIVVLAFNIPLVTPPAEANRTFTDVLPGNVFYQLIETAAAHRIVTGYTCGGVNSQTGQPEPCDSNGRGYFRPSNFVTRGQLAKIVVIGAGFSLIDPPTPTFTDVDRQSVFYSFIETAVCHGTITGYNDGTFRPDNFAFRSQIAKIVYLAIINPPGNCAKAATDLGKRP